MPEPTNLRSRRSAAGALILTLTVGPVFAPDAFAATKPTTARSTWQRFTSCDRLLAYLRAEALPTVGPYGLGTGGGTNFSTGGAVRKSTSRAATTAAPAVSGQAAPATAANDRVVVTETVAAAAAAAIAIAPTAGSSGTNTQEANVDEGDIVENDGRLVYSVVDNRLRIVDTVANKELGGAELLPNTGDAQMLLDGTRLAVSQTLYTAVGPEAVVSLYDVANPAAPALLTRTHLEGQIVALRSIDHRARLVMQTGFGQRLKFVAPNDGSARSIDDATAENKRVVRRAPVSDWLPRSYREDARGATTPVVQALSCGEVGRPREF